VPHKAQGPIDLTVLSHGASQPEARGLYGGYPASIQARLVLRGAAIAAELRRSRVPARLEDVEGATLEPLAAKQRTWLGADDALLVVCAGGGGYGDPLERDPARVALDVRRDLVSRAVAEAIYGVCLADGAAVVDAARTEQRREQLRAARLAEGRAAEWASPDSPSEPAAPGLRIADALEAVYTPAGWRYRCQRCGRDHGLVPDPKVALAWREIPMTCLSAWNRFGLVDAIAVREFYCPTCALLCAVEVREQGDPPLLDTLLADAAMPQPLLAGRPA
jgi:N-methylhydantoinase B